MIVVIIVVLLFTIVFVGFIYRLINKNNNEHINGGSDMLCSSVNLFPFMITHPNSNKNFLEMWTLILNNNESLRKAMRNISRHRAFATEPDYKDVKCVEDFMNELNVIKLADYAKTYNTSDKSPDDKSNNKLKIALRDEDLIMIMVLSKFANIDFNTISLLQYVYLRAYYENSLDPLIMNARHNIEQYSANILKKVSAIDLFFIESTNKNIINEASIDEATRKMKYFPPAFDQHCLTHGLGYYPDLDNTINIHFMYDMRNRFYVDIIKLLFDKNFNKVSQINFLKSNPSIKTTQNDIPITQILFENSDDYIEKKGNEITFVNCDDGDGMFFVERNGVTRYIAVGVDEYISRTTRIVINDSVKDNKCINHTLRKHNAHFIKSLRETLTYINDFPTKTYRICLYDTNISNKDYVNPSYELVFKGQDFTYNIIKQNPENLGE